MSEEPDAPNITEIEPSEEAKELAAAILDGQTSPFNHPLAVVIAFVMESERRAFEEILEAHEADFEEIGGMELYGKLLDAIHELKRGDKTHPRPPSDGMIQQP